MATVVPFVLVIPGARLEIPQPNGNRVDALLTTALNCVVDAAIALGHFIDCREAHCGTMFALMGRQDQTNQIVENEWRARGRAPTTREEFDLIAIEADRRRLAKYCDEHIYPYTYSLLAPMVHAKSFVIALDTMRSCIGRIRHRAAKKAIPALDLALPGLNAVRDSILHVEQRVLRETDADAISAEDPLEICNVSGDELQYTVKGGGRGRGSIPINTASMANVVSIVQVLLDELPWSGSPTVFPVPWP
ncbi:MAG: hypothetical protein WDO68_20755 [Gammaproteobacteria bacterium]